MLRTFINKKTKKIATHQLEHIVYTDPHRKRHIDRLCVKSKTIIPNVNYQHQKGDNTYNEERYPEEHFISTVCLKIKEIKHPV